MILKRDRYASLFSYALFLLLCSLYDCLVFLLLLLLLHPFLPLFVYFPPFLLYTRPLVSPRRPTISPLCHPSAVQWTRACNTVENCAYWKICESRMCVYVYIAQHRSYVTYRGSRADAICPFLFDLIREPRKKETLLLPRLIFSLILSILPKHPEIFFIFFTSHLFLFK